MKAHHGQYPLPIIRFKPPEARVVIVIGPVPATDENEEAPSEPAREKREEPI